MTYEEKEEIWDKVGPTLQPLLEPYFGTAVSSYGIREGADGQPEIYVKGKVNLPGQIEDIRVVIEP